MAQEASNIYDIKVVTRQKQEITLGEYKGKVLLLFSAQFDLQKNVAWKSAI